MTRSTYQLIPRIPGRTQALMAAPALAGAVAVAVGVAVQESLVTTCGAVVMAASALILALVVWSLRAARVQVELSERGYRVVEPSGQVHEGTWGEVTEVTRIPGSLTFHRVSGDRHHIRAPKASEQLKAVADEVVIRLDRDRGHQTRSERVE